MEKMKRWTSLFLVALLLMLVPLSAQSSDVAAAADKMPALEETYSRTLAALQQLV